MVHNIPRNTSGYTTIRSAASKSVLQLRTLHLTRRSHSCGDDVLHFVEMANRHPNTDAIVAPTPGRSVVFAVSNIGLVKTKGLFGLTEDKSNIYALVSPEPEKAYRSYIEYHLHLDKTLNLHANPGRRKFWYSLRAAGAEKEFDCQRRLSAAGIGVESLAAFRFQKPSGLPMIDANRDEVGAVVFKWPVDTGTLGADVYARAVWNSNIPTIPHTTSLELERWSYRQMLQSIGHVYESIAQIRNAATIQANIYRHAGHLENFIRCPNGRILMVDTDTCILAEELPQDELAPLLVRDLSSDMLRMIATVSLLHWNRTCLDFIETGQFNPFLYYLRGFFGSLLPLRAIDNIASVLLDQYVAWIVEFRHFLETLALAYSRDWDGSAPHRSPVGSKWRRLHIFFTPHCMLAIYSLLQQAKSRTCAFALPDIAPDRLYSMWLEGANHFVKKASDLELDG